MDVVCSNCGYKRVRWAGEIWYQCSECPVGGREDIYNGQISTTSERWWCEDCANQLDTEGGLGGFFRNKLCRHCRQQTRKRKTTGIVVYLAILGFLAFVLFLFITLRSLFVNFE